ncbi:uncharacterized protein N7511_007936 [Penicillium nucicola]|uniref:uncharacterized protein n=1 Tax=Penicillium nucicola TaxID=1850975 RepID=UPI0025456D13|nr:uncharacterized protein N7511_007936 [Penicillium nucicola]KAJ5753783.1 hypothetical protein N7511_007936 [Penicillium nucicola]
MLPITPYPINEMRGSQEPKRRLLLIYIHGFNGTETTFQDLPVHVHGALAGLLGESHVVYTRIYPGYKSHGEFQVAVTQFSKWLSPYESDEQDIILLGHSMGGIIAADVALLQEGVNSKHRILGLVNFDSPFLGIHPHAISTGFGSLFQKGGTSEINLADQEKAIGFETVYNDPNFNPTDFPEPTLNPRQIESVPLSESGLVKGMRRFMQERADEKRKEQACQGKSALGSLLGPFKFASSVNNYAMLRRRYLRLQELENAEDSPERIRFVNYYTYSTGRPKLKGIINIEQNRFPCF